MQRQFPLAVVLECLFLDHLAITDTISSLSVTLKHDQLRQLLLLNLKNTGGQTVEFFSLVSNYKEARTFFIVEVFKTSLEISVEVD